MSRARECGTEERPKQRHATRKDAEEQLWSLVRETGVRRFSLTVYKCSFCSNYHVGHRIRRRHQK